METTTTIIPIEIYNDLAFLRQQNQMLVSEINRLKTVLQDNNVTISHQRRTITEQTKIIRELNKKTIKILEKEQIILNKEKVTFIQAFGFKCTEKSILTHLTTFLGTSPSWDNLTVDNLQRFSLWLRKKAKNKFGEPFNDSTCCTYITRLKQVIKYGYQNSNDASTALKSSRPAKKRKAWLTSANLRKLIDYSTASLDESKVKNSFLICAITGCRISDVSLIQIENIHGKTLRYVPIKTKNQECFVNLSDDAILLLKQLISECSKLGYSDDNSVLKNIFKKLGMTNKIEVGTPNKPEVIRLCDAITFHTARHSFATNKYRYSSWSERELADAMGHCSFNQTWNSYIADKSSVTAEEKKMNQDKIFC